MNQNQANSKSLPAGSKAGFDTSTIRERRRDPSANEKASGAIICAQDLETFRLVDAALNAWCKRQAVACVAALMLAGSMVNGQTVEAPRDSAADVSAVARSIMNADEFFAAYPDAYGSDYADYVADAKEWERKDSETQRILATAADWIGGDIDGGSNGKE